MRPIVSGMKKPKSPVCTIAAARVALAISFNCFILPRMSDTQAMRPAAPWITWMFARTPRRDAMPLGADDGAASAADSSSAPLPDPLPAPFALLLLPPLPATVGRPAFMGTVPADASATADDGDVAAATGMAVAVAVAVAAVVAVVGSGDGTSTP